MGFFDDPEELQVRTYRQSTSPDCQQYKWVVHSPADCEDLASGTTAGSERDAQRAGERAKNRILEKRGFRCQAPR
jgi:hypothetical protein